MRFEDVLFTKKDGVARIVIHRPEVRNAFRALTIDEMLAAFQEAWDDASIGVVVLTGTGDKAFCSGGDQKAREGTGYGKMRGGAVEHLHAMIRNIPKPVIAAVNGYAIGGGHVLQILCDLSIASDRAIFGQVGPRVGSVDPGFGTAYLARVVGEKKAREIWFLCRQYTAQEALAMGLVNKVVPHDELEKEVEAWCRELLEKSPTALALAKSSMNSDSEGIAGIGKLGFQALHLFYGTPEAEEGKKAFLEKRPVDFKKFRKP
ncbi:MAG: 1,4-dihydroxy-2-naphthoyl-CoA synthase [Deltaproteobacteria bacterium RBG_13_65_10]|nr:MAG: 1,4-dihydroxy-2-naphthoyl-CoA synthase [Deltaproteobacteria bacterium RBG_13_65_10]